MSNKVAEDAMIIVAGSDPPRAPPFQPKTRVCVGKYHFKIAALGFPSATCPFPKSPKSTPLARQCLPLGETLQGGQSQGAEGSGGGGPSFAQHPHPWARTELGVASGESSASG